MFHEMFAELSFIFLFQSVKLSLISIEIFIILLLSKLSNHFAWWVIEILFSWLVVRSFFFIFSFNIRIFICVNLKRISIFFLRFILCLFSTFNLLALGILMILDWSLWIWRWSFLSGFSNFSYILILLFLRFVIVGLFFALRFFRILNSHFCNNAKILIVYKC
jgi:hypothetical protein